MTFSTSPRRRHYHVEDCDVDKTLSEPISSFRAAKAEAFQYIRHARWTGIWKSWHVTWSDPKAGYHRWSGDTRPSGPAGGDYTDEITVIPCTKTHREAW